MKMGIKIRIEKHLPGELYPGITRTGLPKFLQELEVLQEEGEGSLLLSGHLLTVLPTSSP